MARPSIAIVVTFFGPAPFWLPAFFLSCAKNPDVRWFMFTDFEVAPTIPSNVTVQHMRLSELSLRASDAFGTGIDITRPRKICDLKIAYGVMFADDLKSFDFWAYSDIDIVWGDIRHFLTDTLLHQYDIVSSRNDRLSGHFTLFRNTPSINRTFELIPNVAAAMTDPHYLHLDERELTRCLKFLRKRAPDSSPRVYWRDSLTMDGAYQIALRNDESLWWRNGKTFDAEGKELMYLHFHKLKKHMTMINFGFDDTPTAFTISRMGVSA